MWNPDEVHTKKRYVRATGGCGDLEIVLTAPNGTKITKTDPQYERHNGVGLITVDASGFPVSLI